MVAARTLPRPVSRNETLKNLVCAACRIYGRADDATHVRDFDALAAEAQDAIDPAIIDSVRRMTSYLMQSVELERYADRKQPCILVYNLFVDTCGQSRLSRREAQAIRASELVPLIGEVRADAVFRLCSHAAWCEQNTRDLDGSVVNLVAAGYREQMQKDRRLLEDVTGELGFDPAALSAR
eukprot:TRINITY_DN24685_c1_g1_i1.p1 TRINITY_DN24685_c1_g1~~TRINITY_DN24685_c1_g1_i1.p1  ORF type:complete len:181 (-),score=29.65 TRINITY_DN24685_c1_g1_i1:41-583(-)